MKILIISYYAPPLNAIPAMRGFSLAKILAKNYEVHIITRRWSGNENTWEEMKESSEGEVEIKKLNKVFIHYLPYIKVDESNILPNKVRLVYDWFKGRYNKETDTHQFYKYTKRLMELNDYKYLFATSTPLNIISLASKLSHQFKVPYIADFRDLHNHLILKKNKETNFKNKIELFFLKRYLRNNLKSSMLVTAVNDPISSFIQKLIKNIPVEVVLNGFEANLFDSLNKVNSPKFEITIIGTLYPAQNIDILLYGFKRFIEKFNDNTIEFNFIGTASIPSIKAHIEKELPFHQVNITPKIKRKDALLKGKRASVLFYAAWPGFKGVYSGKIFEYLGLKRNILIAPGDNDVIDNLISETKSGKVANTSNEVYIILSKWYTEWIKNGKLQYNGVGIDKYTRENQYQKIVDYL